MPQRRQKRDQDGIFRRPDSPYWWASFTDGYGRSARRSTRIRCKDDPQKIKVKALRLKWVEAADIERREGPKAECDDQSYTFDDLMMKYLDFLVLQKRSTERDRFSLNRLYPVFSCCVLEKLGAADVHRYVTSRQTSGVAPGTINKEIGLFSAALNWARKDLEWDVPNPFKGRRQREPEGRIRWLTLSEASLLLRVAEEEPKAPHLVDFIRLALNTGLRRGEMLGLEWRRVDCKERLILLEAQHQKNGRYGSVPLNEQAWKAVVSRQKFREAHCPASPWVFSRKNGSRIKSVRRSFNSACQKAKIEDFRIHDLRHTCATWLVQNGVSIREVAELLRHSDIRMTMRYAHLSPDNIRDAVRRLDKLDVPANGDNVSRLGFTLPEIHKPEEEGAAVIN